MPALTNNETLLAAFNQHIRAILDLASAMSDGSNVTVNVPVPSVTVNVAAPNVSVSCNGGLGGGTGSGSPYQQDPPPPHGETPPVGFDTWDEFNEYKCKAANWIVDSILFWTDLISSFSGTSSFVGVVGVVDMLLKAAIVADTAAFMGVSIVAGLATTWLALGAALIAFAVTGVVAWAIFGDVSAAITSNRESLVCALYNSEPGQSRTDFMEAFNDAINGFTGQSAISEIIDILLPNDITNLLFTKDDRIDILGTMDCSGCDDDCIELSLNLIVGTSLTQNCNVYSAVSGYYTPWNSYAISIENTVTQWYVRDYTHSGVEAWSTDGINWNYLPGTPIPSDMPFNDLTLFCGQDSTAHAELTLSLTPTT